MRPPAMQRTYAHAQLRASQGTLTNHECVHPLCDFLRLAEVIEHGAISLWRVRLFAWVPPAGGVPSPRCPRPREARPVQAMSRALHDREAACWTGRAEVPASTRSAPSSSCPPVCRRAISFVGRPTAGVPGEQVPMGEGKEHERADL